MNKILAVLASLVLIGVPVMATTTFWTSVNTNGGEVNVDNYGHWDVIFGNEIRVDSGTINFDQDIDTYYGHFSNDVRLNGDDLRLDNQAGEQYVSGQWSGTGEGWVPAHRSINFDQRLYAGESSTNWDEALSTQVFSFNGNYIAQQVQVNPTDNPGEEVESDTLNMWSGDKGQSGILNSIPIQQSFGGKATMQQKGKMHADYDLARQWTNIGGGAGSSIESWNNQDWVNFEQAISFFD